MGKANLGIVSSFKQNLDLLASYMGLEINKNKSLICFSKSTFVKHDSFPLKYLGILLVADSLKVVHFNALCGDL